MAIIKDSSQELTDLWCEVFIAAEGPVEAALFRRLLSRVGCRGADTPEEADFVLFGGGCDVSPTLYEQLPHRETHAWPKRDLADLELFKTCYREGIPMVGVCRGAQFGHVMNGGTLFQHVNNHYGDHGMMSLVDNTIVPCISSSHHQMCAKNGNMTLLGVTPGRSTERYFSPTMRQSHKIDDIEAFFYDSSCFLGVQGHPEYRGYNNFAAWFTAAIQKYIIDNPDVELRKTDGKQGKNYRLTRKFMDNRKEHVRDFVESKERLEKLTNTKKENA